MFIALLILVAYLVGVVGFIAWDAFIGYPIDFDGYDAPPISLAAAFWPITLWFVLFAGIGNAFKKVKENRLNKEEKQQRLRIAAEKELDIYIEEVEEEIKRTLRK
ncbi:MAG TPA: hypothetical protein VM577_05435 [Anaerovoracaceae bacterium]|nr:hypothetical protein [Anaerovoracaceae bacterium]